MVEALNEAIHRFGPPEIMNTDQGSQFTGAAWITTLAEVGVKISMDGRGRCMDNIFIERLWRSLKQEEAYLTEIADGFHAQHWQSIRTSNPIESSFATIRHRTKRTKGCLTSDGMLHMMFKLGKCAEVSWRRMRGFAHLAEVIEGTEFINGISSTNPDQAAA